MFTKKQYLLFILLFIVSQPTFANLLIDNAWENLSKNNNTIRYKEKYVEFTGDSKRDIYINGAKKLKKSWNITQHKNIEFKFKYSEAYIFMISIKTERGYRTLMYLPKDKDTKTYLGLGSKTNNGKWQTIQRNLEEDLQQNEPNNHILSVNAFICKGKGQFSYIKLFTNPIAKQWKELSNPTKIISKTYDKEEQTNLIAFHNFTGKESYIYRFLKSNTKDKKLEWKFKYKKDYVIIISLLTNHGYRNLIYTSKKKSDNNYIALGRETKKNRWNSIKRDLNADLKQLYPNDKLLEINAFIYRGEGKLLYIKRVENKQHLERSSTVPIIKKEPLSTCKMPNIKLVGKRVVFLSLKSDYEDQGVIAKDCHGNHLDVETIGNIDFEKRGTYTLHYIATDLVGNVITTTRVIAIGEKTSMSPISSNPITQEEPIEEDVIVEDSDGVDKEYELIKDSIEIELDRDYVIGEEIILE